MGVKQATCYGDFFEVYGRSGSRSDDDSGSCPWCHIPIDPASFCTVCGKGVGADLPCFICKVRRPTFLPDLPDPPRFIRYDGAPSARVGIRCAAAYPGEQTGDIVKAGAVLPFTSTSSLEHTRIDGVRDTITFYELTDGL